jgi:hypothetical protein
MKALYLSLMVIVVLLLAVVSGCSSERTTYVGPLFSGPESFTTDVTSGKVASVEATTADQILSVELTDGSSYMVPYVDLKTVDQMLSEHPNVSYSIDDEVRQQ